MAGDRVDSFSEAKELYRHEHKRRHDGFVAEFHAGPVQQHAVAGTGMDGVAVDLEQLRQAERELAGLHDGLVDHLRTAQHLSGPLGDGTSPVTGPMRKAFHGRADLDGGVQATLLDYIDQLVEVRVAILDTLATYEGVDGEAAARLAQQVSNLDREVR